MSFPHAKKFQEDDTNSKKNIFEAEFAMELARHLILQGYNPKDISLLTTHEGQVYVLKEVSFPVFQDQL